MQLVAPTDLSHMHGRLLPVAGTGVASEGTRVLKCRNIAGTTWRGPRFTSTLAQERQTELSSAQCAVAHLEHLLWSIWLACRAVTSLDNFRWASSEADLVTSVGMSCSLSTVQVG